MTTNLLNLTGGQAACITDADCMCRKVVWSIHCSNKLTACVLDYIHVMLPAYSNLASPSLYGRLANSVVARLSSER